MQTKEDAMSDDRGSWLACAAFIFFSWSFVGFVIRVWAKYKTKTWALDDYAFVSAFVRASLYLFSSFV